MTDTGHGIPENIRDRIFLPFYTTKERGTGLGLAIVHKIIVSHGGSIRAESSSKGTAFLITLPKEIIRSSS
jgi:signal transduction histidine kinase